MTQRGITGVIRPDPFTERLGIASEACEDGFAVTTHQCTADECNIFGVVHGALLFAMADVGMGMALTSALSGAPQVGAVSITADYMRAGKPGLLRAESRLLKCGRTTAFLDSKVRDGKGAVCARFSGIFHIYPNPKNGEEKA